MKCWTQEAYGLNSPAKSLKGRNMRLSSLMRHCMSHHTLRQQFLQGPQSLSTWVFSIRSH